MKVGVPGTSATASPNPNAEGAPGRVAALRQRDTHCRRILGHASARRAALPARASFVSAPATGAAQQGQHRAIVNGRRRNCASPIGRDSAFHYSPHRCVVSAVNFRFRPLQTSFFCHYSSLSVCVRSASPPVYWGSRNRSPFSK